MIYSVGLFSTYVNDPIFKPTPTHCNVSPYIHKAQLQLVSYLCLIIGVKLYHLVNKNIHVNLMKSLLKLHFLKLVMCGFQSHVFP